MDAAQQSAPSVPIAVSILTRDEDHKYWLLEPGRLRPENIMGVTEVMTDLGFENDKYFTETHSSRGTAIHAELANRARGFAPFPFIDPDLYGWCQSGGDFLDMMLAEGATVLGVETMRHHPLYRYAGTIDLHVFWRKYEWVLDWKSGKASKVTRFKIAAYDTLLGPTANGLPRKRAAVEVQEDGSKAKLIEYNKPEHFHDSNRFLGYLNTARDLRVYAA